MAKSISPPSVTVTLEQVTTSISAVTPTLPTLLIAALLRNVSAFDDNGNAQADAYAGIYRDGFGTIAYALPGLEATDSLVGFETDVRAFLLYGHTTRELRSEADEALLHTSAAVLTSSTKTVVFADAMPSDVVAGDFVRLTFQGVVRTYEIAAVLSATVVELVTAPADDVTATIEVVSSPAEFYVASTQSAGVAYPQGVETDYVYFSARATDVSGDPAAFRGALGDDLSVVIDAGTPETSGQVYVGSACFSSAAAAFTTTVNAVSDTLSNTFILLASAGDASYFRDVEGVVSGTQLGIAGGASASSGIAYRVLRQYASGANAVTDGTGNTLTAAGATFTTSIPNTGGTPDAPTLVQIAGVGTYAVSAIVSDTVLTIVGTTATQNLTAKAYVVASDLATGSDGVVAAASVAFSSAINFTELSNPSASALTYSTEASTVTPVNATTATLSGTTTAGSWLAYVLPLSTDLAVSYTDGVVTVALARTDGLVTTTLQEIVDALTDPLDPAYSAAAADVLSADLVGSSSTLSVTHGQASYALDGGSDASNILLERDLLGSSTPTAKVYVSYRALRTDLSASITEVDASTYEAVLGAASAANPLSLMAEMATAAASNRTIRVLGVDEVSAAEPLGTYAAYARALDVALANDAHCIVFGSNSPMLPALAAAHATAASSAGAQTTRVMLVTTEMPTYSAAEVLTSGAEGNTTSSFAGSATARFTSSSNFTAAGVTAGDILVVSALAGPASYLEAVPGGSGRYGLPVLSVASDDDFAVVVDATDLPSTWNTLVDVDYSVFRPGTAITAKADQAEAIAAVGEGVANRRVVHVWPDTFTSNGSALPGFYLAAAVGGLLAATKPAGNLSGATILGGTAVAHSNDYFTPAQLNRIAGGGTLIVQRIGTSLSIRRQLTTDTTNTETQELSIIRALDAFARALSVNLEGTQRAANITDSFITSVAHVIQAVIAANADVVASAELVSLGVSPTASDEIEAVIDVSVFYPANTIRLTVRF